MSVPSNSVPGSEPLLSASRAVSSADFSADFSTDASGVLHLTDGEHNAHLAADTKPDASMSQVPSQLLSALLGEIRSMKSELQEQRELSERAIQESLHLLYEMRSTIRGVQRPHQSATVLEYWDFTDSVREQVKDRTSSSDVVVIPSGHDIELEQLRGRRILTFPNSPNGQSPAFDDGLGAIAHLEALRAEGATVFVFPGSQVHWESTVPSLWQHIEEHFHRDTTTTDDLCLFYLTSPAAAQKRRPAASVIDEIDAFEMRYQRAPSILEWGTNYLLGEPRTIHCSVLTIPESQDKLPYLTESIDLVVIDTDLSDRVEEASRVAKHAVLNSRAWMATNVTGANPTFQETDLATQEPLATIVIRTSDSYEKVRLCLIRIEATVPSTIPVEIILVDDASTDQTAAFLAQWRRERGNRTVLTSPQMLGRNSCIEWAAEQARGRYLVLVDPHYLPLSGWLSPLLRTFMLRPDVGMVVARTFDRNGAHEESGGIVYRNGELGRWPVSGRVANQQLTHIRGAVFHSTNVCAIDRGLFREIGGFNSAHKLQSFQDADFCFAVRDKKREVYLQPESNLVRLNSAVNLTAPTGESIRFSQTHLANTWRDALRLVPARSELTDSDPQSAPLEGTHR